MNNKGNSYNKNVVIIQVLYLLMTVLITFVVFWAPYQSLAIWDAYRDGQRVRICSLVRYMFSH